MAGDGMDESYSAISVDVKWVAAARSGECNSRCAAQNGLKRSGILIFDADSESPEKLSILGRQPENGFLVQVGIEPLAVDEISFAPLVEPDGHFQDEEKIVSRSANAGQDVRNLIRFG
jgi:hypothetical protein